MKKYENLLKMNPMQKSLALDFFLENGKARLLNDEWYQDIQEEVKKEQNKKGKIITPEYLLDSIKAAREIANLNRNEFCKYIYEEEKLRRKQERDRR